MGVCSEESDDNSYESEANYFASNALIPERKWKEFRSRTNRVLHYNLQNHIENFARENHINAAIVMGRYQYETNQYNMRNKFRVSI